MAKNKLTTVGYFIKRLRDSGYVTDKVFTDYSKIDPRSWTVVVDPRNSSVFITCYNNHNSMGEKWTRTLQDGSEFTFQFDYEEIEDDVELYFGVVSWNDTQWVGCIVAEKDGSLGLLDFVEDTGEFETYDNVQISSKFEPKQHRYLNNELGKLNDEVDYYVEEVIIPDLMN